MAVSGDCFKITPIVIELKIVIGKRGNQQTQTTQFMISEFTNYKFGILPGGWFSTKSSGANGDPCHDCAIPVTDDGANPHQKHWWQGAGRATVLSRSGVVAGGISF